MADGQKQVKINISVPESLKPGRYANIFSVTTTSAREVVFDFVFVHPNDKDSSGNPNGVIVSRTIMSTDLANALKMALESQLGKIKKE
jgi:hypothetical protein